MQHNKECETNLNWKNQKPICLPIPCSHNNHPVPTDTLTDLIQTSEPNGHLDLSVLQTKLRNINILKKALFFRAENIN